MSNRHIALLPAALEPLYRCAAGEDGIQFYPPVNWGGPHSGMGETRKAYEDGYEDGKAKREASGCYPNG